MERSITELSGHSVRLQIHRGSYEGQKTVSDPCGLEVTDGCGCRESNLGPVEGQSVPFSPVSSNLLLETGSLSELGIHLSGHSYPFLGFGLTDVHRCAWLLRRVVGI